MRTVTALAVLAALVALSMAAPVNKKISYVTRPGGAKTRHYIANIEETPGEQLQEEGIGTNCGHRRGPPPEPQRAKSGLEGGAEPAPARADCVKAAELIKVPNRVAECANTGRRDSSGKCRQNWG